MPSDDEKRYAIILPFQRNHIERLFQGKDVICKFIGHRTVKIGKGSKVLFYASGGSREVIGEGTIAAIEYTNPDSATEKNPKRLFLSKDELQTYKGNRTGRSILLVLELINVMRFQTPFKLAKPLTMAGQTLGREEYVKITKSHDADET